MLKLLGIALLVAVVGFVALWFVAYRRLQAEEAEWRRLPLAEALEKIRTEHKVPALAVATFHRGKLVDEAAVGLRQQGSSERVTTADRWHFGSCGKSMTATLAALLVEEGKLRWESTLAEILPDVRMHDGWRAVTLEQLLQHRGGAAKDPPDALWTAAWKRRGTPAQQRLTFVSGLLSQPPRHAPGTKFEYSNQGYALAGVMMERRMGQTWEELMRTRVFQPLGLSTAGFGAPGDSKAVDQPRGHHGTARNLSPVQPGPDADNPPAIGPAGTIHASIGDWARYASWHAMRGRDTALKLSPENFARLHRAGPQQTYALGWETLDRPWAGGAALMHAGSNTMWFALTWVAPEKEAAFVAATNAAHDRAFEACDAAVTVLVSKLLEQPGQ